MCIRDSLHGVHLLLLDDQRDDAGTGSEVFKGRIEDKFTPILQSKLAVYGCEMVFHKVCDDDPAGITAAILEAKAAGCELIFTTGGMSVDPDDRTPLAIDVYKRQLRLGV